MDMRCAPRLNRCCFVVNKTFDCEFLKGMPQLNSNQKHYATYQATMAFFVNFANKKCFKSNDFTNVEKNFMRFQYRQYFG